MNCTEKQSGLTYKSELTPSKLEKTLTMCFRSCSKLFTCLYVGYAHSLLHYCKFHANEFQHFIFGWTTTVLSLQLISGKLHCITISYALPDFAPLAFIIARGWSLGMRHKLLYLVFFNLDEDLLIVGKLPA